MTKRDLMTAMASMADDCPVVLDAVAIGIRLAADYAAGVEPTVTTGVIDAQLPVVVDHAEPRLIPSRYPATCIVLV